MNGSLPDAQRTPAVIHNQQLEMHVKFAA